MSTTTTFNLELWETLPLPSRQTIANFWDGNPYKMVYQTGRNAYGLLTFKKAEETKVCFCSPTYGYVGFSERDGSRDFKYYPLTASGIGNLVEVGWQTSSTNNISNSYKCYTKTSDSIIFTNFTFYDYDQETIVFEPLTLDDLSPEGYFQFKSIGVATDDRVMIGETWHDRIVVDCNKTLNTTYTIDFDETPTPYMESGSHLIKGTITSSIETIAPIAFAFNLNIYTNGLIAYPNEYPFPPQDGMQEVLVVKGSKGVIATTTTGTKGVRPHYQKDTLISWAGNLSGGGYSACAGANVYKLVDNEWVFQVSDSTRTYQYPLYSSYIESKSEGVIYSSLPIYDKGNWNAEIVRPADEPIERLPYERSLRPLQLTYEYPDPVDYLAIDQASYVFTAFNSSNLYMFTIEPENKAGFRLEIRGNQSTIYLYPNGKILTLNRRKYNPTTGEWEDLNTTTNVQTSFGTSYVKFDVKSGTGGISAFDVIDYTTAPIYLCHSTANPEVETFLRGSDFKITVDENSQPPIIDEIIVNTSTEEPYDVDTKFTLDYSYTLEEGVKGLIILDEEWENKQSYYAAGTTPVRVRAQDNRGLWSGWKEIEINVEKPITSDEVDIYNLPVKDDGQPYQHYFVAIREVSSVNINNDIYCFAFDLKEGESVQAYLKNNSNNKALGFKKKANEFIEYSRIYLGYTKEKGWGSSKIYAAGNYNSLVSSTGYVDFGVKDLSVKNIYVSTFPLYYDNNLSEYRAYPINKPEFPLSLEILTSHEDVWTSDDVVIQATVKSNGNDWKNFHYRVNNGEAIALSNESETLTFTESGAYQVDFYVYNSENVETKVTTRFKIDKESPLITFEETTNRLYFKAVDKHSGFKTMAYRQCASESDFATEIPSFEDMDEKIWITIKSESSITKPKIGGKYYYQLVAEDMIGNRSSNHYILDIPLIPIEKVTVPQPLELKSNRSYQLSSVISYSPNDHNESIVNVSYESLSPELFSITDEGLLQPIDKNLSSGVGQFKITVIGSQTTHEIIGEITIVPLVVYPTRLRFEPSEITIEPSEPFSPTVVFTPEETNQKTLTYQSSDSSIVSLNSYNQIVGRNEGTAIVTATTANGIEAQIKVNVLKKKEKPVIQSLSVESDLILVGEPVVLKWNVVYDTARGAEFKMLEWTTNPPQESYDQPGSYLLGLKVCDTNDLWSDVVYFTLNVYEPSPVKVKVDGEWLRVIKANQPSSARVKVHGEWMSLLTTVEEPNLTSPIKFKRRNQFISVITKE